MWIERTALYFGYIVHLKRKKKIKSWFWILDFDNYLAYIATLIYAELTVVRIFQTLSKHTDKVVYRNNRYNFKHTHT